MTIELSIDDVVRIRPYSGYPHKITEILIVEFLSRGRKWWTLQEILNREDISVDDRVWLTTHQYIIGARKSRELGCDFAGHVLPIYEQRYLNDVRPRRSVEVSRCYAKGKATTEELCKAREDAEVAYKTVANYCTSTNIVDTSSAAVVASATYAAYTIANAYYAAAAAVVADVDAKTEREWQLKRIHEVIAEIEKEEKR